MNLNRNSSFIRIKHTSEWFSIKVLLLLNGLHIRLRRLNDKMGLPLTKKVSTVAGDSVMQFFSEMVVVVLGEAWEYTVINICKIFR